VSWVGVLCGGSWCVDRNKLVDRWPEQENIARILAHERQGGGNGSNASVDLKRLGATFPIEAVGVVGDDEDGRFLLDLCKQMGIDARLMTIIEGVPTAFTDVMAVNGTGKRTFFYCAGSHDHISPDHFDVGASNAAILHLGLPGTHATMDGKWHDEPSGWVAVIKKARAVGMATNLELCPVPPERNAELARPCLPYLDYIVINDAEAGAVAGITTLSGSRADPAACEEAARAILDASAARLVAVHFPAGAVAVSRDGAIVRKPSVRVPQDAIKSANGAGDAFASGMLLGIHEGWPLEKSLALANATAAASLRSVTTNGAVEHWRDCLALADKWGWREHLGDLAG
jgi:sugar/nucleoside kinase (ribokinase family)